MNTPAKAFGILGAVLLCSAAALHAQSVNILGVSAVSTNAGAKLTFTNAASFEVNSGYVEPLTYNSWSNRYPATLRMYSTSNLVFWAGAGIAPGANVVCEVVSVTGPVGGIFSFWERGSFWPTYSFPVNGTFVTGSNRFDVSDILKGAGLPGGDANGALAGRRFSVNLQGEYIVTFQLYDVSKNHPTSESPIHVASDPLSIKFITGVDLGVTRLVATNNPAGDQVATLAFKQSGLTNLYVEGSTNLADWYAVAGPFPTSPTGTNVTTRTFTNTPSLPSLFFRLQAALP
jgi:hypothetical protein